MKRFTTWCTIEICLALSATATIAGAQLAEKLGLTLDGAAKVIAAAMAQARKVNAPGGVIAVVDDGGNLMALERIDGPSPPVRIFPLGKSKNTLPFANVPSACTS